MAERLWPRRARRDRRARGARGARRDRRDRGLGPRKALFDRWFLGFKILQEDENENEVEAHINF